jgi:hypothetical protein
LAERRANFLSSPPWIQSRNAENLHNDPLRSFLNHAYTIPPIFEELDRIRAGDQKLSQIYKRLLAIWTTTEQQKMVTLAVPPSFLEGCRTESLLAESIVFLDFSTAVAALYYDVLELHMINLIRYLRIRIEMSAVSTGTDEEHFKQLYQYFHRICRYCRYFLEEDKKLTGCALFFNSFQVSLLALPDPSSVDYTRTAEWKTSPCVRDICQYLESVGFQPWDECRIRWRHLRNLSGHGSCD